MNKQKKDSAAETSEQFIQDQLAELRAGNQEAFGNIVNIYLPRLKSMARIILRSEHDVEDVVQESLFRAYNALDKFRGEAKLSTWLCRIVVNQAKNYVQRKYRKNEILWSDTQEDLLMNIFSVKQAEYGKKDLQESVNFEINQLSNKSKTILLLRLKGLKYSEIAEMQNCSIGTVKSQLARIRNKLKQNMKKYL